MVTKVLQTLSAQLAEVGNCTETLKYNTRRFRAYHQLDTARAEIIAIQI